MNNGQIEGLSCKQSSRCPCTNKIAENHGTIEEHKGLITLREILLNGNGVTKENQREHRGRRGNISKVLKINYKDNNKPKPEYWIKLINHILKYHDQWVESVLNSMSQGGYLPYRVFEYDGETVIDTKDRILEKEHCEIRESNIFCYGKKRPRNASKIWFDFIYQGEVLYNLEVRFKGEYFGGKGRPQLFVYKESKEDIELYKKTRDKYIN